MKIIFIISLLLFSIIYTKSQWINDSTIPVDTIGSDIPYLGSICIVDTIVSWVAGYHSFAPNKDPFISKKTTNGWKQVHPNGLYSRCPEWITAKDSSRAWIGTAYGKLLYTSDGGYNWQIQVSLSDSGYFNGIKFSDRYPNIGYAFADSSGGGYNFYGVHIMKTTDGGLSWSLKTFSIPNYIGAWGSISVVDSNYAWIGIGCNLCHDPKLMMTSNGGINWNIISIGGYGNAPNCLQFSADGNTGVCADYGTQNRIYTTTNSGVNWIPSFNLQYFLPELIKWVYGTSNIYMNDLGSFMRSNDNGINWTQMTPIFNDQIYCMDVIKNGDKIYGLAVTHTYQVYKLIDTVSLFGIKKIENEIPASYSLNQNYPNPFNPSTLINYQLPVSNNVKLVIYDVLGREVATLVNEKQQPGKYQVTWDASNFASGVYFYKLVSGDFIQIRKMVVLK